MTNHADTAVPLTGMLGSWWCVILVLFLVALVFCVVQQRNQRKQATHKEQEQLKQAKLDLQALDEALSGWLDQLNLPQLEEQTKRQETARQLRTVLIEKLMRQKVPD